MFLLYVNGIQSKVYAFSWGTLANLQRERITPVTMQVLGIGALMSLGTTFSCKAQLALLRTRLDEEHVINPFVRAFFQKISRFSF